MQNIESIIPNLPPGIAEYLYEPKQFTISSFIFPCHSQVALPAIGSSTRMKYKLDVNKKSFTLTRITFQNRMANGYILLRLDIDTKPHKNPNGESVGVTHLHIFDRQDTNGSWAFELDDSRLNVVFPQYDFTRLYKTEVDEEGRFLAFCELCNLKNIPTIQHPDMTPTLTI